MALHPIPNNEADFNEIVKLITSSKERAYQAVNVLLIDLYWKIGGYISQKIKSAEWGDSVVRELATHITMTQPNLKGFTRSNLFRMRQFYETYCDNEIVAPLAR